MIRRTIVNRRNRRKLDTAVTTGGNDTLLPTVTIALTVVTFTFNQPVSLKGVPQIQSVGANASLPLSATRPTPTTVACTYAATQAASTSFVIPDKDPAIRTYTGGFARPGSVFP